MIRRVLFLGSPKQNAPWIDYCINHQIPFISIYLDEPPSATNFPKRLQREWPGERIAQHASYKLPLDTDLEKIVHFLSLKQFVPTFIVCASEIPLYIDLEEELNQWYDTETRSCARALDFYRTKSAQDRICNELGIPTIPKSGEHGLCVKRDAKNFSTSDDIPKVRWEPSDYQPVDGEYVQAWIDQDYHLGLRLYADHLGNWHLLLTAKFWYVKGVQSHLTEPYNLSAWESECVLSRLRQLCNHMTIRNRFMHMEMIKPRDHHVLYHMDFNNRHGGTLQSHRGDRQILNIDYPTILLSSTPPEQRQTVFRTRHCRLFFYDHHHRFTKEQIRRIRFYEDPGLILRNDYVNCDKITILRRDT